jgi:hypothetical protein
MVSGREGVGVGAFSGAVLMLHIQKLLDEQLDLHCLEYA